jgi:sensor c-di-GMP phosphodiesterase-like protein
MDHKQLHLASKVDVPAQPAQPAKDGKPAQPAVKAHTVELFGYSNRAVRYRMLTVDQMNAASSEAAKLAGEQASEREIYQLMLMSSLYLMVLEVTDPTDEPLKEKTRWHKTNSVSFMTPGDPLSWSVLFTAKDTALLQSMYRKWHQVPAIEVEMLAGKEIAYLTAG